jgi:predicted nucleic acid-binding protein
VNSRGLLDTSVFLAEETGRQLNAAALPVESAISVITVAELHAGVLIAADTQTRARRLATLEAVSVLAPLPVTAEVARHWAILRTRLHEEGRKAKIKDLWIAAIAAANGLAVVTQDEDFDPIAAVGGPPVIRV